MATLADLIIRVRMDGSQAVQAELVATERKAQTLGRRIDDVGGKLRGFGRNMSLFVTAPVVALGAAATDMASDLRESQNAIRVVFEGGTRILERFGRTSAETVGLSTRAFNQMVTPIGAAMRNVGFAQDQAALSSIALTQRAADMASVFNTDVQDAMTAIQASLRGEADPIERFGVNMSAAAVQAHALSLGINASWNEMTQQEKMTTRLSLFMSQTERVAGDFAATSDEVANKQRIATAEMENQAAAIGQKLIPVKERLIELASQLLDRFSRLSDSNQDLTIKALALAAALGPVVYVFGALIKVGTFLITGFKAVGVVIGAAMQLVAQAIMFLLNPINLVITLVIIFREKIVGAFRFVRDKVMDAIGSVVDFFTGTVVPMWNNIWDRIRGPVLVAVQIIKTVVGLFVAVVLAHILTFVAFVTSHWDKIKTVTAAVFGFIRDFIGAAWDFIWAKVQPTVTMLVSVISVAWTVIRTVTQVGWAIITTIIGYAWGQISAGISASIEMIKGILSAGWAIITGAVTGAWDIIKSVISAAWTLIKDSILADIVRYFAEVLGPAFSGLAEGISNTWTLIKETAKGAWNGIVRAVRTPINAVIGFINTLIGGINAVIDLIPGLNLSIPEIPTIGASAGETPAPRPEGTPVTFARGGTLPPFITNGPTAIVGEGNPRFNEFVIPTDPRYRGRALKLYGQLGSELMRGSTPKMDIGGIIGDAWDAGTGFIGDVIGEVGDLIGGLARQALVSVYRPINEAARVGLNGVPNVMNMRDVAQGFRISVWDWVRGADAGLPEAAPPPERGSGSRDLMPGSGVERWRGTAVRALRHTGQNTLWASDLLMQMQHESGGNPNAINLWDINALRGTPSKGLMQVIDPTFNRHAGDVAHLGIWDPFANIVAAIRYTVSRYGDLGAWRRRGFKGYGVGGFVQPPGGIAHPGELVLTHADQARMIQAVRGGGQGTTIIVQAGAVVIKPEPGQGDRDGREAGKSFLDTIAEKSILTSARIK